MELIGNIISRVIPQLENRFDREVKRIKQTEEFKGYNNTFCLFRDCYSIQSRFGTKKRQSKQNRGWRRAKQIINSKKVDKKLSDNVVYGHLLQQYWIGVKSPWYPSFTIVDIDSNDKVEHEKAIEQIAELVGGKEKLLCVSSSPRGGLHIMFNIEYKGKPPTHKLMKDILQDRIYPYELYPKSSNVIRLPFGFLQRSYFYDKVADEFIYNPKMNWQEQYKHFANLETFDLATLPYIPKAEPKKDIIRSDEVVKKIPFKQECQELIQYGLQEPNSRNDSQFKLLVYYARQNINKHHSIELVRNWIRKNHNGYSKEINKGNWKRVYEDIHRQAELVYNFWESIDKYPDIFHNKIWGYACKEDISLVMRLERELKLKENPYITRSRLYNLICYARARRHHKCIYIPKWVKAIITGDGWDSVDFFNLLDEKGLITINHSYLKDEFSKSMTINFKLTPVNVENESELTSNIINVDDRAIHDFGVATAKVVDNYHDFMELTGAGKDTYYRAKSKVNLIV